MMTEEYRQKIALFRYGIIAPLVTMGEVSPETQMAVVWTRRIGIFGTGPSAASDGTEKRRSYGEA